MCSALPSLQSSVRRTRSGRAKSTALIARSLRSRFVSACAFLSLVLAVSVNSVAVQMTEAILEEDEGAVSLRAESKASAAAAAAPAGSAAVPAAPRNFSLFAFVLAWCCNLQICESL